MNGNICVLKSITEIKNDGNESMHIPDRNFDSELVSMCQCILWLMKIYTFNLRNPICTVSWKIFPCIGIVTFLNTIRNEWTEEFCYFREKFHWRESRKKTDIFCCFHIVKIIILSRIVYEYLLNPHQYVLVGGGSLGDRIQDVKLQV